MVKPPKGGFFDAAIINCSKATNMFITIINDSNDDNAKARQATRYANLFPSVNVSYVGIDSSLGIKATIEAAGNLIDVLDASDGKGGVIAVNVAPRGQIPEDGGNGSRFCYFWVEKTLVVSTIKGYNLSLVKKFGLVNQINVLETKEVLNFAEKKGLITKAQNDHISNSQFRSFDFQPRVAKWLMDGVDIPSTPLGIEKIPDIPPAVWHIDSFGNIKTTLTLVDLLSRHPELISRSELRKQTLKQVQSDKVEIKTNIGIFKYYERLKDIPDGETAIYEGSSGIGKKRFIEIATQNKSGSAQAALNLNIGEILSIM